MKSLTCIFKTLLATLLISSACLAFVNCNSTDLIGVESHDHDTDHNSTRAVDYHWKCAYEECGFPLNGGWQNYCSQCKKEFSVEHTFLLTALITHISQLNTWASGDDIREMLKEPSKAPLEMFPFDYFLPFAPEPWYEHSVCQLYYTTLKSSSQYLMNPVYANEADFAWHRTVKALYPDWHLAATVQSTYDKFILSSDGRNMSAGLKAGSKAAIDAFKNKPL